MHHTVSKSRFNRNARATKLVLRAENTSGVSAPPVAPSGIKKDTSATPVFIAGMLYLKMAIGSQIIPTTNILCRRC